MGKEYYDQRNSLCIKKTKALLKELPPFLEEYFIGIEQRSSPLTRMNYAYDFRIFFDFLKKEIARFEHKVITEITLDDLNTITSFELEKYLSYLSDYEFNDTHLCDSEKSKLRKISSLRSMFKYFYNKDKLTSNVASKVLTPKIHDKEIIRLEYDEVARIINEAENADSMQSGRQKNYQKHTALRDTAILTLFLGTGIRISELVGLNIEDFDFSENAFTVTRKGGNRVVLYFSEEVAKALQNYLTQRQEIECEEKKAMFLSLQKKRIGVRAVENLVEKYAKIVSPLKHITPHKLRSTYGTNLYRETQDIYIVAEVLGHKDVNTTKKHYAAISEDLRRSVADKVKLRSDSNEDL